MSPTSWTPTDIEISPLPQTQLVERATRGTRRERRLGPPIVDPPWSGGIPDARPYYGRARAVQAPRYSEESKRDAIALVASSGRTVAEVARKQVERHTRTTNPQVNARYFTGSSTATHST